MISLIGKDVAHCSSGKYRVIIEGESTFYPQVKGWIFWHALERWGHSEMDCYYDTMLKALAAIDAHKREMGISKIKRSVVPVD